MESTEAKGNLPGSFTSQLLWGVGSALQTLQTLRWGGRLGWAGLSWAVRAPSPAAMLQLGLCPPV